MANYLNNDGLLYLWQKVKAQFATKESVPTKTSELTNDSGYITIGEVPDTGVVTFNGRSGNVNPAAGDYTADMVGALPSDTAIPSKTSELTNDSNYITAAEAPITSVNNKTGVVTLGASDVGAVATTAVGTANGVCPLNSTAKIDSTYLPSYIDDVVEAYTINGATPLGSDWLTLTEGSNTPITPETGIIYVILSNGDYQNMEYRWGGTTYIKISDSGLTPITNAQIDDITEAS